MGFKGWGLGFRAWGLGFRVYGSGSGCGKREMEPMLSLGFRVQGSWLRVFGVERFTTRGFRVCVWSLLEGFRV